jgi:hypothetical protein
LTWGSKSQSFRRWRDRSEDLIVGRGKEKFVVDEDGVDSKAALRINSVWSWEAPVWKVQATLSWATLAGRLRGCGKTRAAGIAAVVGPSGGGGCGFLARAAENEKQKAAQNSIPVKKRRARVILWVERMQI